MPHSVSPGSTCQVSTASGLGSPLGPPPGTGAMDMRRADAEAGPHRDAVGVATASGLEDAGDSGPGRTRGSATERREAPVFALSGRMTQLRCLLTSLVISNIDTVRLPPKTARSLSSALMFRRSFASWRLFLRM